MKLQNSGMLLTLTTMTSPVVGSVDIPLAAPGTWRATPSPLHWGTAVTYDLHFNQSTAKRV